MRVVDLFDLVCEKIVGRNFVSVCARIYISGNNIVTDLLHTRRVINFSSTEHKCWHNGYKIGSSVFVFGFHGIQPSIF